MSEPNIGEATEESARTTIPDDDGAHTMTDDTNGAVCEALEAVNDHSTRATALKAFTARLDELGYEVVRKEVGDAEPGFDAEVDQ